MFNRSWYHCIRHSTEMSRYTMIVSLTHQTASRRQRGPSAGDVSGGRMANPPGVG
jgi:hypothetical protein